MSAIDLFKIGWGCVNVEVYILNTPVLSCLLMKLCQASLNILKYLSVTKLLLSLCDEFGMHKARMSKLHLTIDNVFCVAQVVSIVV